MCPSSFPAPLWTMSAPPPPYRAGSRPREASDWSHDPAAQEVELFESSRERENYDNLADLYAVILATEHLERSFARDAITREEVRAVSAGTVKSHGSGMLVCLFGRSE